MLYRITTHQVNTTVTTMEQTDSVSVNTVPVGAVELDEHLDAEATMHAMSGWKVRRSSKFVVAAKVRDHTWHFVDGEAVSVRAEVPVLVVRVIYAVEFDPAQDGDPNVELKAVL